MHALGIEGELLDDASRTSERPTIPVPSPRDSGICLKVTRVPLRGATVDAVVCDLSRAPRSDDFAPDGAAVAQDEASFRGVRWWKRSDPERPAIQSAKPARLAG